MNRPIKFRVWDKANNKFINPFKFEWDDYYKTTGMVLLDLNGKIRIADYAIGNGDNSASSVYSEVDNPDNYIVQEYTGLTDKNNIEVYDGDIVKINRCYTRPFVNEKQQIDYKFIEGEVEVGKVLWGWNTQKYLVSYEHIRYDDIEDFDKPSHRVEVIGNIFEHKHLLEN